VGCAKRQFDRADAAPRLQLQEALNQPGPQEINRPLGDDAPPSKAYGMNGGPNTW